MIINNNLLGFCQIIAPYHKNKEHDINNEIHDYLVKHCIENESWGQS